MNKIDWLLKTWQEKKEGSALMLALLVIALVSLASFAIGKVVLSEIGLSTSYGNQEVAYWAAEAGIEKGLLFYRLNEENPVYPTNSATYDDPDPEIVSLSSDSQVSSIDPQTRTFELQITDLVDYTNGESFILAKDQGLTLRVPESDQDPANLLEVKYENMIDYSNGESELDDLEDSDNNFLYIRKTKDDGTFEPPEYLNKSRGPDSIHSLPMSSGDKYIQIRSFINNNRDKIKVTLTTNPSSSDNKYIGGPYTYIQSTGHYRGVKKKLEVKIDRESTTIFDIMDYVIYSEDQLPAP